MRPASRIAHAAAAALGPWLLGAPVAAWAAAGKPPAPRSQAAAGQASASTMTYALPLLAPTTEPLSVGLVIQRLEGLEKGLRTLSAEFRQFVRWDDSGVTQSVEGSLEFQRPDLLRVEHRLPETQTIVADGTWVWAHRRSSNQVIQARFADWKKSEALAQGLLDFGNYHKLLKTYDVEVGTFSAARPDGHRSLELVLRSRDKDVDLTLRLRMSTRDFFPADTEMRVGQVRIHSLFSRLRYNPPLAPERFRFSPPPGADVFKNFRPPKGR